MNWKEFLINYWAQIALVIAAFGYVIRVFLNYKFKKKEIWQAIFQQKKMEYHLKYWEMYYTVESELLGLISLYKSKIEVHGQNSQPDALDITLKFRSAGQLLSQLM